MDKLEFNTRLNGLKDAYPDHLALIESIQTLFNKKFSPISKRELHSLLQFPMQYTARVRTSSGEWTTQMHIWADFQLEDLLRLDPMYLTTKNSMGDSVLMSLILAATGRYTQQVNYGLIDKILGKNMSFMELTAVGDPNSKKESNAWEETDVTGKTPMDYLVDFAYGTGDFEGQMQDERLIELLDKYKNTGSPEEPVDTIDEDAIATFQANEAELQQELEEPNAEPQAQTETPSPASPLMQGAVLESLRILGEAVNH